MDNFINQLKHNWKSGLVVAIVSIPLSISLAIASGATPLQGLISAIWAMGIAAIFASSRHNIFGPAGALSGILLAFTLTHGAAYLPFIAITSGVLLIVAYISKSIRYITLIPAAGLQGFLFAVGLTILISQIPGGLGISIPTHEKIYLNVMEIFNNLSTINWTSFAVCIGGLGFLFFAKKQRPKIPGAIILSVIGICLGLGVQQGRFPSMDLLINKYPNLTFGLRDFSYLENIKSIRSNTSLMMDLFKVSAIIAIVTILETIISGKIGEKMTKVGFNKDNEVLGNAVANIGSGLMGGIPATAVLVRTALNIKSGATSKYSQGIAALSALLISALLFNNVFTLLPMSIIAAILIFIAIGIMDFSILQKFYTFKKTSFYLILITIIFSVLFDTITGIIVGTSLTLLIFIARTTYTEPRVTIFRDKKFLIKTDLTKYIKQQKKGDLVIMKFAGELNYLNIDHQFTEIKKIIGGSIVVFSLDQLSDIDIDGLEYMEDIVNHLEEKNVTMYITGRSKGIKRMCLRVHSLKTLNDKGFIYDSKAELLNHFGI